MTEQKIEAGQRCKLSDGREAYVESVRDGMAAVQVGYPGEIIEVPVSDLKPAEPRG